MTNEQQPEDPRLEALIASITACYGDRIPQAAREKVRESIKGLRTAVEALAAYPLANADEPDPIFVAYRGED